MTRETAKQAWMDRLLVVVTRIVHGWNGDDRYRAYKALLDPASGWKISSITKETCEENKRGANVLHISLSKRDDCGIMGTYFCVEV